MRLKFQYNCMGRRAHATLLRCCKICFHRSSKTLSQISRRGFLINWSKPPRAGRLPAAAAKQLVLARHLAPHVPGAARHLQAVRRHRGRHQGERPTLALTMTKPYPKPQPYPTHDPCLFRDPDNPLLNCSLPIEGPVIQFADRRAWNIVGGKKYHWEYAQIDTVAGSRLRHLRARMSLAEPLTSVRA